MSGHREFPDESPTRSGVVIADVGTMMLTRPLQTETRTVHGDD
ncbi:hypothetical protein [Haloarchaeobius sp. DYHT-AS-18]